MAQIGSFVQQYVGLAHFIKLLYSSDDLISGSITLRRNIEVMLDVLLVKIADLFDEIVEEYTF